MSFSYQKIYIAGHTGLVGSALVRYFKKQNVEILTASRKELDLTRQQSVEDFLSQHKPDAVVLAAGRVGGIQTNSAFPADFIYENVMMEINIIHAAYQAGVKRLLNFGSSCIYPKECSQPMSPDLLMTGKLEPTNEPYAIAKFAGMSLCSSYNRQYGTQYINAIPSNLYGPNDCFDSTRCHVIAAMIRRFHGAKQQKDKVLTFWGTGNVERDFLFIDDFAKACDLLLQKYEGSEPINVGIEAPCTIRELAHLLAEVTDFEGDIQWDTSKPEGASKRLLDASEIKKMGFRAEYNLKTGLQKTYQWFLRER